MANKTVVEILVDAFDKGYAAARQVVGLADEHYIKHREVMVDEASRQLYEAVMEIIGEFEKHDGPITKPEDYTLKLWERTARNGLQAEQRVRARAFFGIGETEQEGK